MAYTKDDFLRELAIFSVGGILGPTRLNKLISYAGRKGIQLAGFGARTAASPLARAATNPYLAGAALGGAALQTDPGQDLLAAAAERGRQDRIALERLIQDIQTPDLPYGESPFMARAIRPKRKASAFNKAVKAGMKAVRASKFDGKKGKITNPKRAFGKVTKIASRVSKGGKVSAKGVSGVIKRAVSRYVKKKPKARAKPKKQLGVRVRGRDY